MFGRNLDRKKLLTQLQENSDSLDNVLAMTHIGFAFCAISTFEDLVSNLVLTSKAQLKSKLDAQATSAEDLFLERYHNTRRSTLGALMKVIERSGIEGRDIDYLHAIVRLRNNFIHNFMSQAPLPGDWDKYGYSLEDFVLYTEHVMMHVNFANNHFSRIMVKHGLLEGQFGSFGALLWNPDDPWGQETDE